MASCLFDYNLSNQGPAQSTDATGNAVANTAHDGEDAARPTPSIVARSRNNGIHDEGHYVVANTLQTGHKTTIILHKWIFINVNGHFGGLDCVQEHARKVRSASR